MSRYVIPATPGWRAVYSEAGGLPSDEPLDAHVCSREIAAWYVDDEEEVQLSPLVADGGVVWSDPPDVILAPGETFEDKRWLLTHPTRKETP